jgi:hypothetical protein
MERNGEKRTISTSHLQLETESRMHIRHKDYKPIAVLLGTHAYFYLGTFRNGRLLSYFL